MFPAVRWLVLFGGPRVPDTSEPPTKLKVDSPEVVTGPSHTATDGDTFGESDACYAQSGNNWREKSNNEKKTETSSATAECSTRHASEK